MDATDTPETPTLTSSAWTALGIHPVLLGLLCFGGAALLCTCLLWLGERRARAESEANARAFRAAAALQSAQPDTASAHVTAHLEHACIGIVAIPFESRTVN